MSARAFLVTFRLHDHLMPDHSGAASQARTAETLPAIYPLAKRYTF